MNVKHTGRKNQRADSHGWIEKFSQHSREVGAVAAQTLTETQNVSSVCHEPCVWLLLFPNLSWAKAPILLSKNLTARQQTRMW